MLADSAANALVSTDLAECKGELVHLPKDQALALDRARSRLGHGDATAVHAVSLILDRKVLVPIYRWDAAQKAVAKLAKKAARRDLAPPKIEELSRETNAKGETWITARILGAAPVLNGWRCVATLTQHADPRDPSAPTQTIVYEAEGETCPESMRERPNQCDHRPTVVRNGKTFTRKCGSRKRNLTFVIAHEDGRTQQVGSSCLNEYLGTDALRSWFIFSELQEQARTLSGWGSGWFADEHAQWLADNPQHACKLGGAEQGPVPLVSFLAAVSAHVRAHGYLKSREAYNRNVPATGRAVWSAIQTASHEQPNAEDMQAAESALAWCADFDPNERGGWGQEPTYRASVALAVQRTRTGGVELFDANLVASMVPCAKRAMARQASAPIFAAEALPVEEGQRIALDLTVVRDLGWALSCADTSNRCVLVQGGTIAKHAGQRPQAGAAVRVMGEVRSVGEYRGQVQTRLRSCKVYLPGEETKTARQRAREYAQSAGFAAPSWA